MSVHMKRIADKLEDAVIELAGMVQARVYLKEDRLERTTELIEEIQGAWSRLFPEPARQAAELGTRAVAGGSRAVRKHRSGKSARIGDILVEKGYVTMEQIEEALMIQRQASKRKLIGEILVDQGVVTKDQVEEALDVAYAWLLTE